MKKWILVALISLSTVPSYAGILFAPSVTYLTQEQENKNVAKTDVKLSIIDLRLGYVFDMGLYFGGIYSLIDNDILTNGSDFHFGPSVGYFWKGLLATFTYHVYGEKDLFSGGVKYANISGYQLDVAYALPLTKSFSFGPQLSYYAINYKEAQTNGLAAETDYKWSGVIPQFAMQFMF